MLSTVILLASAMVANTQVSPRVAMNQGGTEAHVSLELDAAANGVAIRLNGTSIQLYPNTGGVGRPDVDIDAAGNKVVSWAANVTIDGTGYTVICVSVNGGPPEIARDAYNNIASGSAARVTVGHNPPAGAGLPITVAWLGSFGDIYAETFTGNGAAGTVVRKGPAFKVNVTDYNAQYRVGDVASGDNGDFVVSYTRAQGFTAPVGVVLHGFYHANSAERFNERKVSEMGGPYNSTSELAGYHDGSFVVAYNYGYQQLNAQLFSSTGVAGATTLLAGGTGMRDTGNMIAGQLTNLDRAFTVACARDKHGTYRVAWSTAFTPAIAPTNYAYNIVFQKVGRCATGVVFKTFNDDSNHPRFFRQPICPSIASSDCPFKLVLDFLDVYLPQTGPSVSSILTIRDGDCPCP